MSAKPELTTFLTFENKAQEAASYYVSIFDGRILRMDVHPRSTSTLPRALR